MTICDVCCKEMSFDRLEWAKYTFSSEEELVSIYHCDNCGAEKTIRDDED